jgi:hypothetical protein
LPATFGRPSMKSMARSTHTWEGMSNGYSNPTGWSVPVLLRWQVLQVRTQSCSSGQWPGTLKSERR